MINEDNAKKLALFGISLKNETSKYSIIQLKNISYESKISNVLYNSLLSAIESYRLSSIDLPAVNFGVELEFIGSDSLYPVTNFNRAMIKLLKDKYLPTGKYSHNNGNFWLLGKDGSLDFDEYCEYGYELSTEKLSLFNEHDESLIDSATKYIKEYLNGRTNITCGTHVHISMKYNTVFSKDDIMKVLHVYSSLESLVFDPIVPASRRRNKYCKKTIPDVKAKYQKLSTRYCTFDENTDICNSMRFECRQLEGTLDSETILNWATLQSFILYDILSNIGNKPYLEYLSKLNIFQILFKYNMSSECISFFIDRIIKFRSRNLYNSCK